MINAILLFSSVLVMEIDNYCICEMNSWVIIIVNINYYKKLVVSEKYQVICFYRISINDCGS